MTHLSIDEITEDVPFSTISFHFVNHFVGLGYSWL